MARRRPWVRWGWQPMDTAMHLMETRLMDSNLSLHNNQWYQRTTHQMGCHHRPWVRWVAPMEWYKRYNKGKDLWVKVNFFGGIAVWLGGQWELLSHLSCGKIVQNWLQNKDSCNFYNVGKSTGIQYTIGLKSEGFLSYVLIQNGWFGVFDCV